MKKNKTYQTREDDETLNVVSEPAVAYLVNPNTYTPQQSISKSRDGVSKFRALKLAEMLNLTITELCSVLHISERTLQRYHEDDKLSVESSEKIIMLANLAKHGEEVFESLRNFNKWLKSKPEILNGETPLSYLDTAFGFQHIDNILGRIEHGVYS